MRVEAALAEGKAGGAIDAADFVGDAGRPNNDFGGEDGGGRRGECRSVRELCDLGERTDAGLIWRDAARPARVVGGAAAVLLRFLGFSRSAVMFSLSEVKWSLLRLRLREGDEEVAVFGREPAFSVGGSGSGFERSGFACGFGGSRSSEYLSMSSKIFVERKDCGILLIRISRRDRSPWVCKAYVALSLRARSVTAKLARSI